MRVLKGRLDFSGLSAWLRAAVRARVRPHVTRDHVAPAGGVRADGATVRLLAGVRTLVRRQVIGAREYLPAR